MSNDSRQHLMDVAVSLFARNGYDGTTVRDIAKKARLNLSLVSYHFGSKEGLYCACLERFGKERLAIAERVLTPVTSREDFKTRLRIVTEEITEVCAREPELLIMLFREVERDLQVAEKVFCETFLRLFSKLVSFFEDGQKHGFIRKDLDPVLLVQMFEGTVLHFMRLEPLRKRYFKVSAADPLVRKRFIEHFCDVFFAGILERKK